MNFQKKMSSRMFLDKNWIEIISSFQWLFKMVSSFVAHFVIWNGGGWIVEGLESVFDRKIGSVFGFLWNHFNRYMVGDVQSNNYNYIPQWNLLTKKRHFKVIWSMSELIFRNRFNLHTHLLPSVKFRRHDINIIIEPEGSLSLRYCVRRQQCQQ